MIIPDIIGIGILAVSLIILFRSLMKMHQAIDHLQCLVRELAAYRDEDLNRIVALEQRIISLEKENRDT